MNALFGSICIKYKHTVCFQTNTEVFPSVSNHNYNKSLKSDWLSTALISVYVPCLKNSTVRAIRRALKWKLSCFNQITTTTKFSNLIGYQLPWFQRTCHAYSAPSRARLIKWNFSCFDFKKRALYITNFVQVMINWQQNFVSSNSVCSHTCD